MKQTDLTHSKLTDFWMIYPADYGHGRQTENSEWIREAGLTTK